MQGTVEQVLEQHGFSGRQLLGLARKAANDALRRHGAFLDDDRYDELVSYMLEVGCRYALRYERGHQLAIQTFLYRRMRQRYVDWLRMALGDSRHPRAKHRRPAGGFVPLDESDGPTWDDLERETIEDAAERLGDELCLSGDARYALLVLVVPVAEGDKLQDAARAVGVSPQREARALVAELTRELEVRGIGVT